MIILKDLEFHRARRIRGPSFSSLSEHVAKLARWACSEAFPHQKGESVFPSHAHNPIHLEESNLKRGGDVKLSRNLRLLGRNLSNAGSFEGSWVHIRIWNITPKRM